MPRPYPMEFRRDVVAVARRGEAPLKQVAADFGIAESCLRNWLRDDDVEDGNRAGVNRSESTELREANRRIRLLEQENEGCAVRRRTCPRRTCREKALPARE